jgi:hypothetical protein
VRTDPCSPTYELSVAVALEAGKKEAGIQKLQYFYGPYSCNVPIANPFLVVPLPTDSNLPTLNICTG